MGEPSGAAHRPMCSPSSRIASQIATCANEHIPHDRSRSSALMSVCGCLTRIRIRANEHRHRRERAPIVPERRLASTSPPRAPTFDTVDAAPNLSVAATYRPLVDDDAGALGDLPAAMRAARRRVRLVGHHPQRPADRHALAGADTHPAATRTDGSQAVVQVGIIGPYGRAHRPRNRAHHRAARRRRPGDQVAPARDSGVTSASRRRRLRNTTRDRDRPARGARSRASAAP